VRGGGGLAAGEGGDGGSGVSTGRRLCAGPRSRRVCVGTSVKRGGPATTDDVTRELPGMLMP